jgi:hypothetical protein
MKSTIKDVAKLAGVSFKSVSRVINNEPTVSDKLKAKVWAAIEELDYEPNPSARGLRGAPSSIGFIYDNPNLCLAASTAAEKRAAPILRRPFRIAGIKHGRRRPDARAKQPQTAFPVKNGVRPQRML